MAAGIALKVFLFYGELIFSKVIISIYGIYII
jgi:hypothetical protein